MISGTFMIMRTVTAYLRTGLSVGRLVAVVYLLTFPKRDAL
jgi:hypothetical protein